MVTVFTTIFGRTDPLRPCPRIPGVRYFVFADRPISVEPYDCIPYDSGKLGARLASRRLKILADHPLLQDSAITLWHDAAYQLRCNPITVAEQALAETDIVAFRHPHRDQIEDEATEIARLGLSPESILREQVKHYRAAGFTQTAITSTGFCFRRRTPAVEAWQQVWWDEVARWSWRDQMSVDYALWRTGVTVKYIPGHYRDNPHARWTYFHP